MDRGGQRRPHVVSQAAGMLGCRFWPVGLGWTPRPTYLCVLCVQVGGELQAVDRHEPQLPQRGQGHQQPRHMARHPLPRPLPLHLRCRWREPCLLGLPVEEDRGAGAAGRGRGEARRAGCGCAAAGGRPHQLPELPQVPPLPSRARFACCQHVGQPSERSWLWAAWMRMAC